MVSDSKSLANSYEQIPVSVPKQFNIAAKAPKEPPLFKRIEKAFEDQ